MKNNTIVLLHGWGCDSESWAPIILQLQSLAHVIAIDLPGFGHSPAIENFSVDAVVDFIVERIPDNCILIGWSLGGMLAVQVAARYPQKISQLITLAANVKFVASRNYVSAMPLVVNRNFNKSFEADPSATLKLFAGLLAQGDIAERALLKKIRSVVADKSITPNWLQALHVLAQLDNRDAFAVLTQPALHILGEADVLVPASAAPVLSALNAHQQVHLLPQAAHALHWSQPEKVIELIATFIQQHPTSFDDERSFKKRVAQSFSRAAHTYDTVANLQRNVGENLLRKVGVDLQVKTVIDLGCGTGYFTPHLQKKFPQASVIGVDLAEGMLAVAKARNSEKVSFACGDAEHLPFATESVDVIFSSLALQWCQNLEALFSELNRVLKPNGQLVFSTLGPNTLHELKSAWQKVDGYVHVNRFKTINELHDGLRENSFSLVEFEQESQVLKFEKLSDLTRELKALGAHNINRGQAEGLTGRKKIEAFKSAYENFRNENTLPATYDVFYIVAEKSSLSS